MNIIKNAEGSSLTMKIEGRLDTTTAPELESALSTALDGVTDLIFDFANLEYISSAGLRVLLSTHKTMTKSGSFTIRNINETIEEVFEVTGFDAILNIE